jgi:hypothetical protein
MSARVYSALLALYPDELRDQFGSEMKQVFLEDLEDSYQARGFFGAASVWYRSLKEVFRVALPARAAQREFAVALIMYVLQEVYLGGILTLSGKGTSDLPESLWPGALVFGFFPAAIAFVALRIGNRAVPAPLHLGHR